MNLYDGRIRRSKDEINFLYELSHWIYLKLKHNGQISQTEIEDEFKDFSPVAIQGMIALEACDIVYCESVYNENTNKTENIYYSKKVVV